MFDAYRNSPALRAAARALVAGVIAYLITVFQAGQDAFELTSFLWGLGGAAVFAVAGYVTPLEPLVGIKAKVRVPADSTTTHEM